MIQITRAELASPIDRRVADIVAKQIEQRGPVPITLARLNVPQEITLPIWLVTARQYPLTPEMVTKAFGLDATSQTAPQPEAH